MTHGKGKLIGIALAGAMAVVWTASDAFAIPAFARRENLSCTTCHTAWPSLTAFGRRYKELGYQVMRGKPSGHIKIGANLTLPKHIPFSLILNSRPYDRKKGGPTKLRALHEVEILAGGNFMNWGSFFAELAAEDEANFDPEIEHATVGLHLAQQLNVVLGKSGPFFADPYNNLNNAMRRFTRAKSRLASETGASGAAIKKDFQNVELYGRVGKLFYSLGLGADRNDDEGAGPDDYSARLAFDVFKKELSVGAFLLDGSERPATANDKVDFRRWGFDFQGQLGNLNYQGAYMRLEDDTVDSTSGLVNGDEENDLFLGELFYTYRGEVLKRLPIPVTQVVPFMRIERFERNDGSDDRAELTLNLSTFFADNFKAAIEYATTLNGPDDHRVTFFLVFGV